MTTLAVAPQEYRRPTPPRPPFARNEVEEIAPTKIAAGKGDEGVAWPNADGGTAISDWVAGADNPIKLALTAWIGGLLLVEAAMATLDPHGRYLPPTIGF